MTKYKRVFEPWQIKNVKFKSRMLKTPQDMNMADFKDGSITQELVDFYEAIARGGIGGIITEQCMVEARYGSRRGCVNVHDDSMLPGMIAVAEAAHKYDCPIIMQINHLGGNAEFPPYPGKEDFVALAPSDLDVATKKMLFHGMGDWPLRALTIDEIKEIIDQVRRSRRPRQDVLASTVSSSTATTTTSSTRSCRGCGTGATMNTAGGASRTALGSVLEVLKACRERVGDDFVLAVKLNGAEYGVPEGTTSQECQEFAKMFEAAGADYFNIVADGYGAYGRIAIAEQLSYPEPPKPIIHELASIDFKQGMNVHLAAAVKKVVSVPVIAVGKLDAPSGREVRLRGQVRRGRHRTSAVRRSGLSQQGPRGPRGRCASVHLLHHMRNPHGRVRRREVLR